MTDFKFGIVGTGMISGMFCDAAVDVPGVVVRSLFTRESEHGEKFVEGRSFGDRAPAIFTDYGEFLASGIDAVYVASPNSYHSDFSIRAMEAGLHVLCEKPIASNRAEYEKMQVISEKTGKVLLEAMRPAFDPGYAAVRNNLPKIGTVRRASFEYCQYSSRYDRFRSGEVMRAFDPSYSNAAVMDIGVYPLYVCAMLFGIPTGTLKSQSFVFGNGMEGGGEVILPYPEMTAVISYSKICDSVNGSAIIGEEGAITIDKLSSPRRIALLTKDGEETVYSSDRPNNMRFEIGTFVQLVKDEKTSHKWGVTSNVVMMLLDEIRRQNGVVFPADK